MKTTILSKLTIKMLQAFYGVSASTAKRQKAYIAFQQDRDRDDVRVLDLLNYECISFEDYCRYLAAKIS